MTKNSYTDVAQKAAESKHSGLQVSVNRILGKLGVSRSDYRSWLKHTPSATEKRRVTIKRKIQTIYDNSHQNYGAPKITRILQKNEETISERTA